MTYMLLGLFVCMMGYFTYFLIFSSRDIINSPYNKRQEMFAERVVRGEIVAAGHEVLAVTQVAEDGTERRSYPYGDLFCHVVGYDTNGKAGLEASENFSLLRSNAFFLEQMFNELKGKKNMGDTLVTTLDVKLQQAAYDALGDAKGAVVVMEPSTGKLLAMVSKSGFDPNQVEAQWEELISEDNEDASLLNRASQGMYPPGSVFKIFTTLEYIREHPESFSGYSYQCEGAITQGKTTITCYDGNVHGQEDLREAFARSCNSAYASMGLSLDKGAFAALCESMLFNQTLGFELPYSKSSFALDSQTSDAEAMMTAIGQGKTQVSPLHMAMVSCAIANGGLLMQPYVVDSVEDYTGNVIQSTKPEELARLMTGEEAGILTGYMQEVIASGTGYKLQGTSYSVAGKTGTAEYRDDEDRSHSWFVGFAPAENPKIAVSIILEDAGSGGETAAPVARRIFDAYYGK